MKTPVFTVIVPAYNAEKYILRCVDSVLADEHRADYELVVVDDGSVDNTFSILEKKRENAPGLRVIHTKNYGVSHARNVALKEANGEYIIFLDADDYLLENWYETGLEAVKANADFFIFDFVKKYDDGNEQYVRYNPDDDRMKWCEKKFLTSNQMNPCWSRIYKKSIIDRCNIKFCEAMVSGEDFVFSFDYFKEMNHVEFIHVPMLYKEETAGSAMHCINILKCLEDDKHMMDVRMGYMKAHDDAKFYGECLILHFRAITHLLLQCILREDKEEDKRKLIHMVCNHPYVHNIIENMSLNGLPIVKKMEYQMMRSNQKLLLPYFKMKAGLLCMKRNKER